MTSRVKSFFIVPHFTIPPPSDDGPRPIELGSIITDPAKPLQSLNLDKRVIIPDFNKTVTIFNEPNWKITRSELAEGKVSLWAKFSAPQAVGLGAEGHMNRGTDEMYKCERLETQYFQPSDAYIYDSLQNSKVRTFIRNRKIGMRAVYMVTGIKIAWGAEITTARSDGSGGGLKGGVNSAAVTGIPVSFGPEVSYLSTTNEIAEAGPADRVLAYQLLRIRDKRDGTRPDTKDFIKGALLGDDQRGDGGVEGLHDAWDIDDLDGMTSLSEGGAGENVVIQEAPVQEAGI